MVFPDHTHMLSCKTKAKICIVYMGPFTFESNKSDKYIYLYIYFEGAQWLSGRVLDSRPRVRGFEPHHHHCVMVL